MLKDFISLIFPQTCINCRQSLNSAENYLCTLCKIDLPVTNDHMNVENQLYQKFAYEPKIKSAAAYLFFHPKSTTKKLLYELKYKGKKDLGIVLGNWSAHSVKDLKVDYVVPVPLHRKKQRRRTYNQSEYIAKGISEVLEFELKSDLVGRIIDTNTQTKKTKVERWQNMENVYSKIEKDLNGKSILIIDDVITTGATVGMLAARFVEANAKEIHIFAIARGK